MRAGLRSGRTVEVNGWSSSAAFFDFHRDGFLDLYGVRYVDYRPAKRCSAQDGRRPPFRPIHDIVLHNEADGSFRDVSEDAGIASTTAAGLGLVCLDLDGDGWQDVYVANDAYPNQGNKESGYLSQLKCTYPIPTAEGPDTPFAIGTGQSTCERQY